ncbi:hypothetical protein Bpfe_015597 [Biomphalaria pfeifferi]|uniref:Uncharacterized protein n=1 Tax=Biomphalaria pfeifferi TaxID=112525 RepID=A0AAD8BII9_BIOPF|nr:hypothetical protein Bpfe_015597 [Biomphalaria pfeifferi]
MRESRSFPERRRLRAILKNFASDRKPANEGDSVSVCNGVNVKTSIFWTPKTDRLVRDYDRRKTITICLGAFLEATTDDSAIHSRPTLPCWPLVRCKSYTSTLHIHLPEVSASSEFLSSRVSSIDKMAATAGQSRPLATNSDLPSSLDLRRSSSGFGSYRVIRRSSQMLSDSGPLVPTSGSTSHGSASSPLLQIAGDISGSLLTLKRNSTRRTPTDLLSATLDTNNTHVKRSTANQEISSSNSSTNSSTNVLRETAEPNDISMSSSHSSVQDSSDVSRLKDNSVQQTSTDSANIGKIDARGDDSRESLSCMPLSQSPSARDSSSVLSDSLERRRKSKMFSELIEVGRQLLSESGDFLADGSYVVTLQNLDSAPRHQNQQNNQLSANIITEKDRTRFLSEANQQETDHSLPEQRTKSRFLSSLYSGQEKIKSFINKGRNQLKAHELSMRLNPRAGQPTGHLDSLAKEGLRNISNEKPYLSDGGDKQGIDSDEMSQRVSPITPSVPVTADGAHKTGPIGGKSSSREEDNRIHKSLPTADVTSTSEHWTNRAESVAQLNSRLRDRLESNQTTKLSVDTLGRRLSSSSDDVFTPGSSSDTRLWSFNSSSGDSKPFSNFEFSDLSHLKRPQSLSPASTASSSRCGTPTLSGSKTSALPELGHISDRRRFSLPDVMEVKAKVQGALKTAADIHHKYSSGRLGPLDWAPRPRSGSQHFKSDKPLTVSHPSPRTTKPKDASTVSHNVATTKNTSKSHVLTKDKHGELLVTELTNEELPSSKAKTSVLDKTDVNVATSLDGKRSTPKRAGSDVVDYKGTQRASFQVTSHTSATSKGLKERPATTGQLEQSHVVSRHYNSLIKKTLSLIL